MQIEFKRDILPHLVAVLAFYIITLLYFSSIVIGDKTINQHDITQWEGASKELRDYREKTGEEGLWINSMFSGMPAYLVNTEYSDKVLVYVKVIASLGLPHPIRNVFLAFVSFYILLLVFKVNPYLSIGGAIAFGMSSYLIIGLMAGHNARVGSIALMPLVMAGIHYTYTYRYKIGGAALTALALALHLRENHLQITYYLLLIALIYGAVQLILYVKENKVREFMLSTGILVLASLLGLGTFMGKFLTTLEYSKYSIRGKSELKEDPSENFNTEGLAKSYAFEYSNGILEPLTLFIPNIFGGSTSNFLVNDEDSKTYNALMNSGDNQSAQQLVRYTSAYWGSQRNTAPYYGGAIIVFLFIIGLITVEKKYVVWLSVVSGLGIILSWGDNFEAFNYFMFDHFPGYNKFRSVTFAMLFPLFAMPLLGMMGLQKLTEIDNKQAAIKKLFYALAISGGFCLLVIIAAGMITMLRDGETQLPRWFTNALQSDRRSLLRTDALRSLGFILVSAGILWLYLKEHVNVKVSGLILTLFITVDLYAVDRRYLSSEQFTGNKRLAVSADNADREILKDNDPGYRVYNIASSAWNESTTSYYHHSIGGYHGAKLRRYQELIEYCIEEQTNAMISALRQGSADFSQYGVINMLNVRYLKYGPEANNIIRNNRAFGSAWLAENIVEVNTADEEIQATCDINSPSVAVIDGTKFDIPKLSGQPGGDVKLMKKEPGYLEYKADVQEKSLAVFSEIYYPEGWKAYSGDEELDILRVNYVLRGVVIDSADKLIRFEFNPASYRYGNTITAISSILTLLLALGSMGYLVFEKPEKK